VDTCDYCNGREFDWRQYQELCARCRRDLIDRIGRETIERYRDVFDKLAEL
jgi:hypothetical protein